MKNLAKLSILGILVALLAFSIISCPGGSDGDYPPPEGMGYVKLNLGQVNLGRTILPVSPTTPTNTFSINDINSLKLIFTPSGSGLAGSTTIVKDILKTSLSTPIALVPDTYSLKVIGYETTDISATPPGIGAINETDAGTVTDTQAVAEATVTVTVTPTTTTQTPVISLEAYDSGARQGVFSYDIDLTGVSVSLTSALMTIKSNGIVLTDSWNPVDLTTDPTDDIDLLPGKYEVQFEIQPTGTSQKIDFTQALWVYRNMTSAFDFEFKDEHFGPQKVRFVYNDGPAGTVPLELYYTFGSKIEDNDDNPLNGSTASPVYSPDTMYQLDGGTDPDYNFRFINWYDADQTVTTANVVAPSNQVMGDMIVYGRWDGNTKGQLPIELATLGGTPIQLSYNIGGGAPNAVSIGGRVLIPNTATSVTFTITNGSLFQNANWTIINGDIIVTNATAYNIIMATTTLAKDWSYIIAINAEEIATPANVQSFWFELELQP